MIARLLFAIALLVLALPSASAQERKPVVPFEGTQAFQHILQLLKLEPIRNLDSLIEQQAEDMLVILFGELDVLDELADRNWTLFSFLKAGGSVLIASDYSDERRLAALRLEITGRSVQSPPDQAFKGITQCPLISPRELDAAHPIFKDVKTGIATNRPSYLQWDETSRLGRLATFPRESRSGRFSMPLSAFVVGSSSDSKPRGRILVFSSHGQFINGMMAQKGVDNFAFAWSCVSWLAEKEGGRRKHALLLESGKVRSDFNVPLTELPPIPIPPTRVINAVLRGMEEEDLFNRVLRENVDREEILQGVMVFLSVVLAFVVGRSLFKARYRLDTSAPLVAPSLEKAMGDVPVLSQRHRALLLQGNLFEAAQMLAQLWFEKRAPEQQTQPDFRLDANLWQRWKLDKQVRKLWDIAHGPARDISRAEFQKLMDTVEQLTDAYDRGVLRFG